METNIESHLALRHDAWCPNAPESSGNSPLPDSTEREGTLEALHSKLHDSGACDHSPTLDDSRADPNWVDQRRAGGRTEGRLRVPRRDVGKSEWVASERVSSASAGVFAHRTPR